MPALAVEEPGRTPVATRVVARLADGRELIYYDGPGVDRVVVPDPRALPDRPPAGEARYDPRTGDWVVVATHRQERTMLPDAAHCPLCPSRDGNRTEIPAEDYQVVVFENRFPALLGEPSPHGAHPAPDAGVLVGAPANGRCEVICFDSRHDVTFADLDEDRTRLVVEAWIDRTRELSAHRGIVQVYCFENRGAEIGVTQTHPHGQIYAYPFVLPRTALMVEQADAYRRRHDRNLFDDIVRAEAAGARVVAGNDEWIAFVPFAARWPYEVHLYPRRRVPDLPNLDDAARRGLAPIYLDLLRRFDRLFDGPAPYIAAWHQAPAAPAADDFALHLELFTNRRSSTSLKYLAGTEAGMNAFSNDVVPEVAAQRLAAAG